jgi:Na+/proline symporter
VTRIIRESGLSGAWFYWNGIITTLFVTFLFARLWRRAEIVTDAELVELRYSGRPAAVMRATIALFRSFVLELITLSWVILGMTKVVRTVMGLPELASLPLVGEVRSDVAVVIALVIIALVYSATSGLWGVVVSDFLEFFVAMGGAVLLAFLAVSKVGGVEALRRGLAESPLTERALDVIPSVSQVGLPPAALVAYLGFQWWAHSEIDGSGKRAQRFLACKDEQHALASGVWNAAVQYVIRNWPWYIAALASVVLYPALTDHEAVYPRLIADLMPVGLKGLMVASLLAAFLSTVDTQLNLSASYVANDIYRRFLVRGRSASHYVWASRVGVVILAAIATGLALAIPSVLDAFRFKMELMAGLGLVYILRWFWWRVNAWAEIAALVSGVGTAIALNVGTSLGATGGGAGAFGARLMIIVGVSAVAAVVAILVAPQEPMERLRAFYRSVQPPALFWGPVAELEPDVAGSSVAWVTAAHFFLAALAVFSAMIGLGKLLLGELLLGLGLCALGALSGWVLISWVFGRRAEAEG